MFKPSMALVVIAGTCAGLLVLTHALTDARIRGNIRERELSLITELAGTQPPASSTWSGDVWDTCNGSFLVRSQATGYGGRMALLVSITLGAEQPRLRGLRITNHQETPGLADFLEQPEHGWLGELNGRTRTDVGEVDAIAGATITSKAVLSGILEAFSVLGDHAPRADACSP